jgi:hypothetical protein
MAISRAAPRVFHSMHELGPGRSAVVARQGGGLFAAAVRQPERMAWRGDQATLIPHDNALTRRELKVLLERNPGLRGISQGQPIIHSGGGQIIVERPSASVRGIRR